MTVVAIVGMAFCGTTMLAGCLERLGVPMVRGGDRGHLEDAEIAHALRSKDTFAALVKSRSGQWGIKHPGLWRFEWLRECMPRETVYLGIFKDPVSVTRRRYHAVDPLKLQDTVQRMQFAVSGSMAHGLDVHWLSYLGAVRNSFQFVTELTRVCHLSVTERQLFQAASVIRLRGAEYGE